MGEEEEGKREEEERVTNAIISKINENVVKPMIFDQKSMNLCFGHWVWVVVTGGF